MRKTDARGRRERKTLAEGVLESSRPLRSWGTGERGAAFRSLGTRNRTGQNYEEEKEEVHR